MSTRPAPGVDVRRAADRFVTRTDWLESRSSFSYGQHYDPANVGHALLLVNNDDVVRAGDGFDTHPHSEMEIVTWVLDGSLVHRDSTGRSGLIHPGLAQRMSAGRGIQHSETNDSWRLEGGPEHVQPVHYVQMWVAPDETGLDPAYDQREVAADLSAGDLVPIASGLARHDGDAALSIRNRSAALHAARLLPDHPVRLPEAPFLHLFVARGRVDIEGIGALEAGDAVRFTATGGRRVAGLPGGGGTPVEAAEVLVWEMHAALG